MNKNLENLQILNDSIQDNFKNALNHLYQNLHDNNDSEEEF